MVRKIITKIQQCSFYVAVHQDAIHDKVLTRQQIVDLLRTAKVDPDGHNIILQGDIVRFTEMAAVERRQLIEEISGISMYEEKKNKALRELERVDEKIKEHIKSDRMLVITFEDTGEGIAESDRERVFEFAYTTREKGNGQSEEAYK